MVTAAADLRRMAVFSRKNKGHKPWVNRRPWKPSTGVLQHLIKAPPVSFLGAGGGELLPTELAALDSILGDDTVISLGGGRVCFTYFSLIWCSVNGLLDWGTQGFQIGDIPDSRDPFQFPYRASTLRQQSYWSHAAASDPKVLSWYWNVTNSPTFQSSSSLRKGKGDQQSSALGLRGANCS